MRPEERIIVALDFPGPEPARALLEQLPHAHAVKVGSELFTAAGPALIRELVDRGLQVFLDLKFHDIPNTVGRAAASAAALGVAWLSVHLSGGAEMVAAAVRAAQSGGRVSAPRVLGVTVLTSLSSADLSEVGIARSLEDQVVTLARLGQGAGAAGVVASPREIAALRRACGTGLELVIPGVRPAWASSDDQKRVATPGEAVLAGADRLVIGRPISAAADPAKAFERIVEEIS